MWHDRPQSHGMWQILGYSSGSMTDSFLQIRNLSIAYKNAQGLGIAKQGLMKAILVEKPIDIMCITESKHSDGHPMIQIHQHYK